MRFRVLLLALLITPASLADDKPREFSGKVVKLADALEKLDAKLDADAAPFWLALAADEGKLYPLLKDPGSRMFFQDANLLNRPVKIEGRLLGQSQILQVLAVRTVVKGKLHEPYYWCDVCKIKRFAPGDCECCGAPLEFREEPASK